MTDREAASTAGIWGRRVGVLILAGLAGFLILGPSQEVVTKFVGPVLLLMIWRNYQRALAQNRRSPLAPKPMSKRGYAIMATLITVPMSLPIWLLCNNALIAITLVPALICIWFGIYLFRGT